MHFVMTYHNVLKISMFGVIYCCSGCGVLWLLLHFGCVNCIFGVVFGCYLAENQYFTDIC